MIAGNRLNPTAKQIQPAEWAKHDAVWLAYPSHEDLWLESLPAVRAEFSALCKAIAGERLEILLNRPEDRTSAERDLAGLNLRFHMVPFGDIWLRDTAPIFTFAPSGNLSASVFRFNGWGEKYLLPHDDQVSLRVAESSGLTIARRNWVLEGGSVEVDGEGTCLTTEQCLLNPNRNPGLGRGTIETLLAESLGTTKVLWLKQGLQNDHTDGHIDTLARFVEPGKVICMRAASSDDPNFDALEEIYSDLRGFSDAKGRTLEVVTIPSPGILLDDEGEFMPASYVNFYIANESVLVPTYGVRHDEEAVYSISRLFPGRRTVGCSARSILEGGGAFHCITQQQPSERIR